MRPYKPSNQIDKNGWRWLALTSGIGGLTLGGVAFMTSFVVYLIIILPILLGLAGGVLLRMAVYRGKVRNPWIAGVFALATGIAIYGTMHGADYVVFRQNATKEINRTLGNFGKEPGPEINVDKFLQQRTGANGFGGFMRYRSQTGIVVNRASLRIPVKSNITWSYWGLEFLITSAISFGFAFRTARRPFCENCHGWYNASDRLGRIKHPHLPEFLEAIDQDSAFTASKFIDPLAKVYPPSLEIHLQYCNRCQSSNGLLTLSQAFINKNSVIKFLPYRQGIILPKQSIELAQAVREHLDLSVATLSEQENPGQSQLFHQVALAQKERSEINEKTTYTYHNLPKEQLVNLQQQLSSYVQIKQAYLVQKVVQTLPESPFYLLGIVRKKSVIESVTFQTEWESEFGNELEFPGNFAIVSLNNNRKLQKQLQQIEGAIIYALAPPVKPTNQSKATI